MRQEITLTQRLLALWDHLGLDAAHVAVRSSRDVAGLAHSHPERIAGLLLCGASAIDPGSFAAVAARMVMVAGDRGVGGRVAASAEKQLPGSRLVGLRDYDDVAWSDIAADHPEPIIAALQSLPGEATTPALQPGRGSHAGITYEVLGSGPALVLAPLDLAGSQWDPIIPRLAENFTVIRISGRHLATVALLEERAIQPSYAGMIHNLFDVIGVAPGDTILDVGCGSGAIDRLLAQRFGGANSLTAVDLNPFLLREAAALAAEDGVTGRITFREGNAEHLPFPDACFDHAYSVTVLEECDADLALRELWRVVKPGGRVGVIVRAIDLPQIWNVDIPDTIRSKIAIPAQLVGARGVADASLYYRMRAAGFEALTCFPALITVDQPDGPTWQNREGRVFAQLTAEETAVWRAATASAREAGLLFTATTLHRVVGRKPAS